MRVPSLAVLTVMLATPALADLRVSFVESAPKDRFVILNAGVCPLGPFTATIALEGSSGDLIFDTAVGGAGVEVAQPFEVARSAIRVTGVVADGARGLDIALDGLAPEESVVFTIDLDDTLENSDLGQIRVAGAEIAGASVLVAIDGALREGVFDATAKAVVPTGDCVS